MQWTQGRGGQDQISALNGQFLERVSGPGPGLTVMLMTIRADA